LDLSPGALPRPGRDSPDAQVIVRGAQVGPDWRNAFRRWMQEHGRYPTNAAVVGEEGTTRIELIVEPDGRVRSGRLVRRSGSVWLDAGTVSLFRNAVLPPFPPGADPTGVTIDLTINYILIR
jgi:TonB family protein